MNREERQGLRQSPRPWRPPSSTDSAHRRTRCPPRGTFSPVAASHTRSTLAAMGYSWVLSGQVNVGRDALAAYKKTSVNPARYTDWPDSWGEPGCNAGPLTVAQVVERYEHADAHDIRWNDDGVTL